MIISHKITIIRTTRIPVKSQVNEEIKWLCNSLGLFSLRDKESSCYRIFIELLKSAKANKPLSSDEIAYGLGLGRTAVLHHLNRLMESGLVSADKGRYMLRVKSLEILVSEVERDIERTFNDLKETAKKIDEKLGL